MATRIQRTASDGIRITAMEGPGRPSDPEDAPALSSIESRLQKLEENCSSILKDLSIVKKSLFTLLAVSGGNAGAIDGKQESSLPSEISTANNHSPGSNCTVAPYSRSSDNSSSLERLRKMMEKTVIRFSTPEKVSFLQWHYKRMDSSGEIASSIFRVLQDDAELEIWVDCDHGDITHMRNTRRGDDGKALTSNISDWVYHVDYDDNKVFIALNMESCDNRRQTGMMAHALSLMVIHKLFNNRGKPYLPGNADDEHQYTQIVKEAIGRSKLREGGMMCFWIGFWVQHGFGGDLIGVVPFAVAEYGNAEGIIKLQEDCSCLLQWYLKNVQRMIREKI